MSTPAALRQIPHRSRPAQFVRFNCIAPRSLGTRRNHPPLLPSGPGRIETETAPRPGDPTRSRKARDRQADSRVRLTTLRALRLAGEEPAAGRAVTRTSQRPISLQVTGHPSYGLPWGQDRLVPLYLATLAIDSRARPSRLTAAPRCWRRSACSRADRNTAA